MVKRAFKGILLLAVFSALSVSAVAEAPAELGTLTGQVIWVDFWASWCTPCRRSFPWMNEMLGRYGDSGLQIIGVNVDKERALAASFLEETPASFELRYDPEGALAENFGVQAMPSSFLLDAEGNVLAEHYGFRFADTDEYENSIIDALVNAGADVNQEFGP